MDRRRLLMLGLLLMAGPALAETPAERGKEALLGRAYTPPIVSLKGYQDLWRTWGLDEKPADFDAQVRQRYGLHAATYANDGLPMGLRTAKGLLGKGVTTDCLTCHSGSIFGKSYVGLPNSSLDLELLFDDLAAVQGVKRHGAFPVTNVRGTSEASAAAAYLMQYRTPDLALRERVAIPFGHDACEDTPAWWLLKRKKTMYATGSHAAEGVRSMMSFLLNPLNGPKFIKDHEPAFKDIHAYLLSMEAPKYPLPIDDKKAAQGKELFAGHCASCHGTYGPDGKYPNKVVPFERIGTDRGLADGYSIESQKAYNASWFGHETNARSQRLQASATGGYQAPPLDGVWATAPYFHNGSVPTLYHVLNSKARPRLYTRSFETNQDDYDAVRVGWKYTELKDGPDPRLPAHERRKVYDTSKPGRGNGGHPFGDKLSESERTAVIEYLKTL